MQMDESSAEKEMDGHTEDLMDESTEGMMDDMDENGMHQEVSRRMEEKE